MRFLILGAVQPEAAAALVQNEHVCHSLADLANGADTPDQPDDPAALLPLLDKRQWNLLTTDRDLVASVYEKKLPFSGCIVLLLDSAATADHGGAIVRLFERYRRLSPRRLYTVTPNRVKIRQLPGGGS